MIERQTDKISPRLDDQLKHETAPVTHGAGIVSRREDLMAEPVEENGVADASLRNDVADHDSIGIAASSAEARAELARHLTPSVFPAGREQLLEVAESSFASEDTLNWLRTLPGDQHFENVQDVWIALGGETELHHT